VQEGQEYSILTAEIAKATFGLTPTEHKETKGLVRENLRDHMTNLELIFTMLGEETTRQVVVKEDAIGFVENKRAAQKGGGVAGTARLEFEQRVGVPVVSTDNFKNQIKAAKKVKKLNTMVDPDL
jgi:DNA-damage-inducible protein D